MDDIGRDGGRAAAHKLDAETSRRGMASTRVGAEDASASQTDY